MRKTGPKLLRTETSTIRLDPRSKYLAQIMAREQRRTLSAFVEWLVSNAFDKRSSEFIDLWDIDENERLKKLAKFNKNLLTYDEEIYLREI